MADRITLEVTRYHPAHDENLEFKPTKSRCEKIGWFSTR